MWLCQRVLFWDVLSNDFVREFLIEYCILRSPVTQFLYKKKPEMNSLLFYGTDKELGNQLSIVVIM